MYSSNWFTLSWHSHISSFNLHGVYKAARVNYPGYSICMPDSRPFECNRTLSRPWL